MPYYVIIVFLFATSCSHKISSPTYRVERLPIQASQPLYADATGQVLLGGLSDLVCSVSESTPEKKIFYAITDRGPNKKTRGSTVQPQRPFVFPGFSPQLIKLEYSLADKKVQVVDTKKLHKEGGSALHGLPNVEMLLKGKAVDEKPIDGAGQSLAYDPWGLDPEGLALDDQGRFWVAEEYGPSLLKVAPEGKVLNRWYPAAPGLQRGGQAELPAFLSERRMNRGFEAAVWVPGGKILLFLQSEIPASSEKKWAPVIEFDTKMEKTSAIYFYPLSAEGGKIGAVSASPSGRLFLLEQNGQTGAKAWQRVFTLDFTKATNVIEEVKKMELTYKVTGLTIPITKNEAINLKILGLQDLEKLEGICLSSEQEIFILNDNDFDVEGKAGESTKSYLFQLRKN